ncbi:Transcription repressor OFP7 [Linum grandiflorum]
MNNANKLSFSFRICRPKKHDAVPPSSAYRLPPPPLNHKIRNINNNYPKQQLLPAPPPTTPLGDASNYKPRLNQSTSLLVNLDLSLSDYSSDSFESSTRKDAKWQARTNNYRNRIYLDSCDFGPAIVPGPTIKAQQNTAVVAPCSRGGSDEEEEAESLLHSSRSFSFNSSSYDFSHAVAESISTPSDCERSTVAAQRLKEMIRRNGLDKSAPSSTSTMGEAMAVVKKSSNPKEDFKRSMMEMISEKEIYQGKELEELLQCLLSLNSRQYHDDIVDAFSDIWKVLFL